MQKIFLFRHAETVDNISHVFSGLRDVDITDKGKLQAAELSDLLKDEKIDISYCSPMMRTLHTLEIVLKPHKHTKICLEKRLIERSYGTLQGKNKDELAKVSLPLFKFMHRSYYVAPPAGESLYSVDMRVRPFIRDLLKVLHSTTKNVAICAHGNSIRPMRVFFEKRRQSEFNKIETSVGELFVYNAEEFFNETVTSA